MMGSLAASRYASSLSRVTASLPAKISHHAEVSLADALSAARKLGGSAGRLLRLGADHAFIDGIHLAVVGGAVLCAGAAVVVFRKLPHQTIHGSALEGPIEAMETTAALGLAGVEPAFAEISDAR